LISVSNNKLSIIFPTLNSDKYIEQALNSLLNQNHDNFECVLIDGGSTDDTISIASNYSFVKIFNQKEKGLYQAWNEAIKYSSGNIIGFLNSDDMYEKNIFANIMQLFNDNPELDIVAGYAIAFKVNNNIEVAKYYQSTIEHEVLSLPVITMGVSIINSHFFRKELFEEYGCFDTTYEIASDRELMLRLAKNKCKGMLFDKVIYKYRMHEKSMTLGNNPDSSLKIGLEHMRIAEQYVDGFKYSNLFSKWYFSSAVTAIFSALKQNKYNYCLNIFKEAWKKNYFWPIYSIEIIIKKIFRRIKVYSELG
jgi:glycosyltransferase involved in cell wall biosynthesis